MKNSFKFSKLEKTDQLVQTLKSLGVSEKDFLASGCTATVFKKGNQVIKVCRKDIRYFSNYTGDAQSFMDHINKLSHIFLPINEILHEDKNFFIYSQDFCEPLRSKAVDVELATEFLQLFKSMIKENCMVSGLSPFNLCNYQGKLLIFDYHGLHPLKKLKSGRIARNLVKYVALAYCPHKYDEYKMVMETFDADSVDRLTKMPSSFINLLHLMLSSKYSPQAIIRQIDKCIKQINN